jgi:hypothetical protein
VRFEGVGGWFEPAFQIIFEKSLEMAPQKIPKILKIYNDFIMT